MASEEQLLEAIGEVQKSIDGVRLDMTRRTNVNRNAIIVAVVLTVVALGVGAAGFISAHTANRSADTANRSAHTARASLAAYLKDRDAARIGSCLQANIQQSQQADAEVKQSHDFIAQLTKGSVDPRLPARVKAYNDEHDALIRDSHALRDCSPAGIRKYLATQAATSTTRAPG